jgi:RNA polymerase sigma-70 factor (ECF subfamily)
MINGKTKAGVLHHDESVKAIEPRSDPMDENQLIQSCLQGNVEDFRKMVDMYKGKAMAFAVNILGNREDAEDACQDTFVRIYHNLKKFDPEYKFKDWMYAILHNRCMDFLRKKKRFSNYFKSQKSELLEAKSGKTQSGFEPEYQRYKPIPDKILDGLSPKERTSVVLWANESYDSEEISNILGCAPSTVRVYLFKARRKIKRMMEDEHDSL